MSYNQNPYGNPDNQNYQSQNNPYAQNQQYQGQYQSYNQNQQYQGQYQSYNQNQQYQSYQQSQQSNPYGQNFYGSANNMNYQNMYQQNENYGQTLKRVASEEVVSKSFIFMFFGLLFTAFAAFTVDPISMLRLFEGNGYLLLIFGELAVVMAGNFAISKDQPIVAAICFTIYSYLTGALFSVIFCAFELSSVGLIFLSTAVVFGVMAVYGIVTKRDITKISSILFMSLIAIIIVSTLNIFFGSTLLDLGISIFGVIIFMGYTAYDAQKIKNMAELHPNRGTLCIALYGGFQLYLDFINLFLKLLRLFGKRK